MRLSEATAPQVLVIYPGRFQPFHKGHRAVYEHLKKQYDNVYIATSDKVDPPRSPFSFAEKKMMMELTGMDTANVVLTKNPYIAMEITQHFDMEKTILMFAVSEKDMAEDPRFSFKPKKDGSPSYLQPAKDGHMETADKHGYIMTVPTFNFDVLGEPMKSATEFRANFAKADEDTKKAMIKDLFGNYSDDAYNLMSSKILESKNMSAQKLGTFTKGKARVSVWENNGAVLLVSGKQLTESKASVKETVGALYDKGYVCESVDIHTFVNAAGKFAKLVHDKISGETYITADSGKHQVNDLKHGVTILAKNKYRKATHDDEQKAKSGQGTKADFGMKPEKGDPNDPSTWDVVYASKYAPGSKINTPLGEAAVLTSLTSDNGEVWLRVKLDESLGEYMMREAEAIEESDWSNSENLKYPLHQLTRDLDRLWWRKGEQVRVMHVDKESGRATVCHADGEACDVKLPIKFLEPVNESSTHKKGNKAGAWRRPGSKKEKKAASKQGRQADKKALEEAGAKDISAIIRKNAKKISKLGMKIKKLPKDSSGDSQIGIVFGEYIFKFYYTPGDRDTGWAEGSYEKKLAKKGDKEPYDYMGSGVDDMEDAWERFIDDWVPDVTAPDMEMCPDCEGSGGIEIEGDCERCDGTGEVKALNASARNQPNYGYEKRDAKMKKLADPKIGEGNGDEFDDMEFAGPQDGETYTDYKEGDHVFLGHITPKGTGIEGTITAIRGDRVFVKSTFNGKIYKGYVDNLDHA